MAFKMKGSPHKMGGIEGTSSHSSALKQVEDEYGRSSNTVIPRVVDAVKKKADEYKPVKTTKVTSDGDKTTATTTESKKKLFGGKKTTTTSTSSDIDEADYTRGDMTITTNRNKRRGGGKKKEVTVNPTTGKKTVTRYKKDGTVKSTKVKKGKYRFKQGKSNKSRERTAIREAEKEN
tara:strand:+ start:593 stop:1123 length:531 start_codon:yes stop_codon:yes gene_type:complete